MADSSRQEALDHLRVAIPAVRMRRRPVETEWLLNHAAWRAQKTRFYYLGESDHYLPAARRSVERFVTRARKQLIPSQDFFEVYPWDEADPASGMAAEKTRAYLLYIFTRQMKLRSWIDQILRSVLLYTRAIVKNGVKVTDQPVTYRDGDGRARVGRVSQVWPFSRVVDPFQWFHWPESATTLDEMQLIFEDTMLPFDEYDAMAHRKGSGIDPINRTDLGRPEWPYAHTIRLTASGLTDPSTTQKGEEGKENKGADFVALTEAHYRRGGRWIRAWLVWNVKDGPRMVRFEPQTYPEPPYRFSFSRQLPGEGYTSSLMSDLEPLNVWLNDQVNLTQDGMLTAMSPPALINPSAVFREDSLQFRPRAKWMVDPSGVQFPTLPDTTRTGFSGVEAILGFMDTFSGANPLADGSPTRGMPRAGFAISTLISLSMADITALAEIVEDEILTPTLSDLHRLGVMFTPSNQRLRIPAVMGLPQRPLTIDELAGDFAFRWVGSIQSQDLQVKAQRMLTFAGMLVKIAPLAQQAGLKVRWDVLLKRLWREGLTERGAETILQSMTSEDAMLAMIMRGGLGDMMGGQSMTPGGGANPASPEQAQSADARNMTESAVGQLNGGLGVG